MVIWKESTVIYQTNILAMSVFVTNIVFIVHILRKKQALDRKARFEIKDASLCEGSDLRTCVFRSLTEVKHRAFYHSFVSIIISAATSCDSYLQRQ